VSAEDEDGDEQGAEDDDDQGDPEKIKIRQTLIIIQLKTCLRSIT